MCAKESSPEKMVEKINSKLMENEVLICYVLGVRVYVKSAQAMPSKTRYLLLCML